MLPDRLIKALLVGAIFVGGGLFWQHQSRVFEDKGRLKVSQLDDADRSVVLSWHSEIEVPMVRRLEEAFDKWHGKTGRFVIDLSSRGGALYEGRKVVEFIAYMKKSKRVDTVVGENQICLSMCVPIYLQGQTRLAAASSKWMFHEPQFYELFSDEKADVKQSEKQAVARRFFERYFTNSDITPGWRDRLKVEWRGKEVWRTGRQLADEGSGIIHQLF